MTEDENPTLDYLSTFHQMTNKSQEVINMIGVLENINDYSDIPVEKWHELLSVLKIMIQSQQDMLKEHVEYRLTVSDALSDITKQFKPK